MSTIFLLTDSFKLFRIIYYGFIGFKHFRKALAFFSKLYLGYPPALLILSDITLRFRPIIIKTRSAPLWCDFPVIQLLPPSDHGCDDDQILCDYDMVCYNDFEAYCNHCLALPQEACACQNEEGVLADGTFCFIVQGDIMFTGECVQKPFIH